MMGILYLIVCGSSSALELVEPAIPVCQEAGWDVCVIATPMGRQFLNIPTIAQLTSHPVRSEYKAPDFPDILPRADAIIVYPASFRTINNWAAGNSDTAAVGILCEYLGLGLPIVAVPCLRTGSGLDTHPAFLENIRKLNAWGAKVLYEPEKYPIRNHIPIEVVLAELDQLIIENKQS
jgi:phosphopantothenoylcysteine synthetase/decarboxylase